MIVGGLGLKFAVVLSASTLLLFAANTAIIGAYHIFLALSKAGFLPRVIFAFAAMSFTAPHVAISIATLVPVAESSSLTRGELRTARRNVRLWPLGRFCLLVDEFGRHSLAIGASRLWFLVWSAHDRDGPGRLVCQSGRKGIGDAFWRTSSLRSAWSQRSACAGRGSWTFSIRSLSIQRLQARAYRASEELGRRRAQRIGHSC